jgi:hypothetical protein
MVALQKSSYFKKYRFYRMWIFLCFKTDKKSSYFKSTHFIGCGYFCALKQIKNRLQKRQK